MSELTKFNADVSEKENTNFYLPATAVSPSLDRISNVVDDLFDLHGVVLVPDTYDK
ncbi:hypothetical protein NDI76_18475 [Halogeometricum sp. S1BR25-6]|uniref:Uncharacterized protein n=1 Tax=Halogeometricum salsisoli TaxID=2950536 RepID=A0ABU2GIS3_9EURY|nr:hypothetical protein [Halogeometricum sp. S1BR25-6]MDS0300738.1 hypothetical protein [Halogeometricum sp. S1BR25-6]